MSERIMLKTAVLYYAAVKRRNDYSKTLVGFLTSGLLQTAYWLIKYIIYFYWYLLLYHYRNGCISKRRYQLSDTHNLYRTKLGLFIV